MTTPTSRDAPTTHTENASSTAPGPDASAAEIEADIVRTREHLGHTVEELSGKLDVKSRARHKIQAANGRATEQARIVRSRGRQYAAGAMGAVSDDKGGPKPVVPAAGAALAVLVAAAVVLVIRRRSR